MAARAYILSLAHGDSFRQNERHYCRQMPPTRTDDMIWYEDAVATWRGGRYRPSFLCVQMEHRKLFEVFFFWVHLIRFVDEPGTRQDFFVPTKETAEEGFILYVYLMLVGYPIQLTQCVGAGLLVSPQGIYVSDCDVDYIWFIRFHTFKTNSFPQATHLFNCRARPC